MRVPFLDLSAQYQSIKVSIDAAIAAVIRDAAFVRGPYVRTFEQEYADAYDIQHCIGVANGTDAIYVALRALGIGPGDEVITAANSWIASSEVITQAGGTPVFADVDVDYFTMDPADLKERITERTRAVIPVHLYGQPADMSEIMAVANAHDLAVVEDTAQAHLATFDGRRAGTIGRVGTFSFYPGKNLGAYGDAGCIITDEENLARSMRILANHGSDPADKHRHLIEGVNSRLDGMQAAILSAKLHHLEDWTNRRISHAAAYTGRLAGVGDVVTPPTRPGSKHVFHIYCIRTAHRDRLRSYLADRGVSTGIHYPTALPLLDAYEYLGYGPEDVPVAARMQSEILSLPIYPEMTEDHIGYVTETIEQFFEEIAR